MSKKNDKILPGPEVFAPIRFLVLDVDGVLTNGSILYTSSGEEVKRFDVKDGAGLKYWRRAGHDIGIITGRSSPMVLRRAEEFGIELVRMNAKNKLPVFRELLEKAGVEPYETAVVGDDLPDIPLLAAAGLAVAVKDAVQEVRDTATMITKRKGGRGAVREVIDTILKAQGKWPEIMERYLNPDASI